MSNIPRVLNEIYEDAFEEGIEQGRKQGKMDFIKRILIKKLNRRR